MSGRVVLGGCSPAVDEPAADGTHETPDRSDLGRHPTCVDACDGEGSRGTAVTDLVTLDPAAVCRRVRRTSRYAYGSARQEAATTAPKGLVPIR
jgi:hypothetical protein